MTPTLVPVPLHRSRIWQRGFNQSAMIARHLHRASGIALDLSLLERVRATPSLRGHSRAARARAVAGAFRVRADVARADLRTRHVILVDDVLASGATVTACARALRKAGAGRISVLTFARVVPDSDAPDDWDLAALSSPVS